ncbi:MAG: hypothetical protein IPL95_19780 [Saprospiraceae bacterium]|nr:hypothetical protein [Saprospiraceae bacterium]
MGRYYSTSNGLFNLPKLNVETNVSPFKTDNIINGLNALDVSILNEHISGNQVFENQNRKFAADVSVDYKISTDLLNLEK